MLALPVVAAFLLGLERAAPGDKLGSFDDYVVLTLHYAGRLLVCVLGAISFVALLHIIALLLKKAMTGIRAFPQRKTK